MFRSSLGENLFQAGITALLGSLAFIRTESYSLTPLGKVTFVFLVIGIVALIRSAIVPARKEVAPEEGEPGLLDALIFVGLLFGLVKRSWLGIFPALSESIGVPENFSERLAAAIGISLMVGLTALAACFIAENLRVIGTSLFSHRFARTQSVRP